MRTTHVDHERVFAAKIAWPARPFEAMRRVYVDEDRRAMGAAVMSARTAPGRRRSPSSTKQMSRGDSRRSGPTERNLHSDSHLAHSRGTEHYDDKSIRINRQRRFARFW